MTSQQSTEKPSLIEKLANVTVVVRNQQAALDYYTKTLGLEKRADVSPPAGGVRWVTVAPKGQDIEISLWEARSTAEGMPQSLACWKRDRHGLPGQGLPKSVL